MNKILTVSIAAYNVEKYIERALNSLLVDNIEDLEILVEDDGGTDNTANIVKEYENKYPGIVKLVHKENGGYGSTINKSIELAKGKYFKQLDGDDWYDSENFSKFLQQLREIDVDAVYTPYKEFLESKQEYNIKDFFNNEYQGEYQVEEVILKSNYYLKMHTVCYKTEMLKSNNIKLLEKCLYTDTQYAMYSMAKAKTIYITHNPVYVYRLGSEEQSVSIPSRLKHYKDHVKVSKNLIEFYNKNQNDIGGNNKKTYLLEYISQHLTNTITNFLLLLPPNKENVKQIKEYEEHILNNNKTIYEKMWTKRKFIKIIRKTNYNYIVYMIIAKINTKRYKKTSEI